MAEKEKQNNKLKTQLENYKNDQVSLKNQL